MPLLSVIIPVFNSSKYLIEGLESILNNNLEELEIIAIDDCSTDNSLTILKQYQTKFKRFILIRNRENRGYGYSCNRGIKLATGKYLAFFEPDDLLDKQFYDVLLDNRGNADIIKYNGIYEISRNSGIRRIFRYRNFPSGEFEYNKYLRFWKTHPSIINSIYNKDFILKREIKFCETPGASYQDVQFNISLYYSKPKIKIVDDCKYYYRRHETQSTKTLSTNKIKNVIENWEEETRYLNSKFVIDKEYFNLQWYRQFNSIFKIANFQERIFILKYLLRNSNKKKVKISTFKSFNIDLSLLVRYFLIRTSSCVINFF